MWCNMPSANCKDNIHLACVKMKIRVPIKSLVLTPEGLYLFHRDAVYFIVYGTYLISN